MKSQFRAINRFISKIKSTSSIDGISNSGTFQIQDIAIGGFSLPQGAFTYFVTADFAQTGKEEIFRIVNTAGDILTYDKRIPVGGYVKPAHAAGASIRVNDVADILNEMSDNIDNFGDITQIDGTQTIKVWGGVFNNGGTVYNVANQTLIVTVGQLVDNTTNYIHFDITTRLFIVTASSTLAAAVCIASVVVAGGTIGAIVDLRPGFAMTYGEISTKLDKSGGLRDSFGANKAIIVDPTSGVEVVKTSTVVSSISDTDVFITRESAAGNEKIVSYANVKNQLAGAGKNIKTVLLGEVVAGSTPTAMAVIAGSIPLTVTLGSNVAGVRLKSGITFKTTVTDTLGRVYSGQNATSASARIQLLNSAGTLITEKTPGIGTDYADFTDIITKDIEYIICVNDTTFFNTQSNELALVTYKAGNPFCMSGYLNGDKNAIPQSIRRIDFGTVKAMKTGANTSDDYSLLGGFVIGPKSLCDVVSLDSNEGSSFTGFTGLSVGSTYYIANTFGTIGTTAGTKFSPIGYAANSTTIIIGKFLAASNVVSYSTGTSGTSSSYYHKGGLISFYIGAGGGDNGGSPWYTGTTNLETSLDGTNWSIAFSLSKFGSGVIYKSFSQNTGPRYFRYNMVLSSYCYGFGDIIV